MIKVSIITPAYNASEFIVETIRSVQNQTLSSWELLVVDDCSVDNTVEIVEGLAQKDLRIKLIKAASNGGVARARNLGLERAKGEFIAFLDSDDLWLSDKLEKQVRFMEENNLLLTYTNFQKFSTNGKIGKIIKCPKRMKAEDILRNTAIGCLTVMINKRKTGDFRMPLLQHTEDNCTWYNILKEHNSIAYNLGEVLAYYRDGNVSLTQNKCNSAKLQWETYRNYYRYPVIKSAYLYFWYSINAILRYL